jgi:hypothetical protein
MPKLMSRLMDCFFALAVTTRGLAKDETTLLKPCDYRTDERGLTRTFVHLVLHEDWQEVSDDAVQDAHRYMQGILPPAKP